MPQPEMILWSRLKGRQLLGYKFRRQFSVGSYILDFYCPSLRLAIEIDGESHFNPEAKEYDSRRQRFIESLGISVVRFTNTDVRENLDGVLQMLARMIAEQEKVVPRAGDGQERRRKRRSKRQRKVRRNADAGNEHPP